MTSDDIDLYYGYKAQEMILTNVRDNIHVDSLALFVLNIEILVADAITIHACPERRLTLKNVPEQLKASPYSPKQ